MRGLTWFQKLRKLGTKQEPLPIEIVPPLRGADSQRKPTFSETGHGVRGYLPVFDNAEVSVSTEEKCFIGEERAWVAEVPSLEGPWRVLIYATSQRKARMEALRLVRRYNNSATWKGLTLTPATEEETNDPYFKNRWTNR